MGEAAVNAFIGSPPVSHLPERVIPIGSTSNRSGSSAFMIVIPDRSETSCSAERPPNSTPILIFRAPASSAVMRDCPLLVPSIDPVADPLDFGPQVNAEAILDRCPRMLDEFPGFPRGASTGVDDPIGMFGRKLHRAHPMPLEIRGLEESPREVALGV